MFYFVNVLLLPDCLSKVPLLKLVCLVTPVPDTHTVYGMRSASYVGHSNLQCPCIIWRAWKKVCQLCKHEHYVSNIANYRKTFSVVTNIQNKSRFRKYLSVGKVLVNVSDILPFFFLDTTAQRGSGPPYCLGLHTTHEDTPTVGMTPLTYKIQTSMHPVEFGPTTPASDRPLGSAVCDIYSCKISVKICALQLTLYLL